MKKTKNNLSPIKSLQLVKLLAESGCRLFSPKDLLAFASAKELDIKDGKATLHFLMSQGWIHSIRGGLYTLDSIFLSGQPIHEFEIATRMVNSSVISHFSAFHQHKLTDQIPLIVYASVPKGSLLPRTKGGELFTYEGVRYRYIQVQNKFFFGFEMIWKGDVKIPITDLERTLLDGLMMPKHCGGLMEVLSAYSAAEFNVSKIVDYALRLDLSVIKRLGWVLERVGVESDLLDPLFAVPTACYIKLDPAGENKGIYHKKWKIRENI